MGYTDLKVFKEHLKDVERDSGTKLDEDFTPSISMDAYFSGGATGVETSYSGHHDGHINKEEEDRNKDFEDEEFIVDEVEVKVEDEFEIDIDIEAESLRSFPFNILVDRLKEVKNLADKGIINGNDYYHIKAKVLEDIEIGIKLDCLNCYDALEIDPSAGPTEVKQAYRRLASQYHPDKVENLGPRLRSLAREEMMKLNHAKEILLDPVKKADHDNMLSSSWSY
jgi:DnaJ-domain-containing protein 1